MSAIRRRAATVTRNATIPVSAGLLRSPDRYFAALTAYRKGDIDPIVQEPSHAALAAVANGRQLTREVVATREAWRTAITARSDSSAWRLADVLFSQPVINADRAATGPGRRRRFWTPSTGSPDVPDDAPLDDDGQPVQAPMTMPPPDHGPSCFARAWAEAAVAGSSAASLSGYQRRCRIRSYLVTARDHAHRALDAITNSLTGTCSMPPASA